MFKFVSAVVAILVFFTLTSVASARDNGSPPLTGAYLGQAPPGQPPQRFAPDVIALDGAIHGSIAFSPDASEVYWTLWTEDFRDHPAAIMFVRQTDSGWTEPAFVPVCDEYGANEISLSPSGERLYFSSRRLLPPDWGYQLKPGTREWGIGKVWYADRDGATWGEPQILDKGINQDLDGVSATNGGTLYASGIRRIRRTADGWGKAERLGPPLQITKPGREFKGGHPYVSPDERFIIFNDDWPGHWGHGIFVSIRDSSDTWSEPVNILAEVGGERGGSVPVLSPDGKYLFYFADGGFWWVDAAIIGRLLDASQE